MDALHTKLREVFGFSEFRAGQREVVERVLAGRHTLAVLPTGSGKSLCYQLAAQMLPGMTIVVSPLIALMKDQTDQLARRGIANATSLSSHLSPAEMSERYKQIEAGKCNLLYIAPERCDSLRFQNFIRSAKVSLLVIDEAHCISQWGHDFRPHYRTISRRLPELSKGTVLAMTATATREVQADIIRALDLTNMEKVIGNFDRPNLRLQVIPTSTEEKDQHLLRLLEEEPGPAIVYCSTRKQANQVHELLLTLKKPVCLYHAGLTAAQRTSAQNAFLQDQAQIVVATVAFGMGIDKPDVRKIIHYNLPGSLESYYQEIGRAGRDGLPATCTLLYAAGDVRIQRFFIDQAHPDPEYVLSIYESVRKSTEAVWRDELAPEGKDLAANAALQLLYTQGWVTTTPGGKFIATKPEIELPQIDFREADKRHGLDNTRLSKMIEYVSGRTCRRFHILRYFGQNFRPPCSNCDVCRPHREAVAASSQVVTTNGTAESDRIARTILEASALFGGRFGRTLIKDVLLGSERKKILQLDLQDSRYYGSLSQHKGTLIADWIEQLAGAGLLQITVEEYPRLVITPAGRQALQSDALIPLAGFAPNRSASSENIELKEFLQYLEKIRSRTMKIVRCIPPDKLEWTYREEKFTIGDLVRHIAAIERYMYAENARFLPSRYPGHGKDLADGYEEVIAFMERCHSESVEIFKTLTATDLQNKCVTPGGMPVTLWKWLRAMIEHEVHHRGQIYMYLTMLEIQTPPLYGLTSEEVRKRSR